MTGILEKIEAKVDEIIDDVSFNITKRYERKDLHIAMLLTYFSPLEFYFDGEKIRGWLDTIFFGDSKSGKSSTIRSFMDYVGLGYLNREKATYAGLVGGIDKIGNEFVAKAGVFTLNNGGLVCLDECHEMSEDDLGRMTDVRSSGIAQITAIRTVMNLAKCRKLWVANPRKSVAQKVITFDTHSPIELFRYFAGKLEDMTRFDLILGCRTSRGGLRHQYRDRQVPHIYTREAFRFMISKTWGLTESDITFTPAAVSAVYRLSEDECQNWISDFPMVVGAEQSHRLARIAAAVAALVRTSVHPNKLEVTEAHVEYAHKWLVNLFKTNDMDYADYVLSYNRKNVKSAADRDEIVQWIKSFKQWPYIIEALREYSSFTKRQISDDILDMPNFNDFWVKMRRANLIQPMRNGEYGKTSIMTSLLNNEFNKTERRSHGT